MLIPVADDNRDRTTTPYVNYLLIAANVLVFVLLQGMGGNDRFTYAFSCVPREIVTGHDLAQTVTIENPITHERIGSIKLEPTPVPVHFTLLTSMFMHGGLAHLFGNMLFLWIFGDNVEDRIGHYRYVVYYLLAGILAGLAHVFSTVVFHGNMFLPSLGASGAISGVLGGYLMLFPRRKVQVILLRYLTVVPAYVAIGVWFLFQIVNSLGAFGGGSEAGGVAYGAHIGGFVAGLALIGLFAAGRTPRPPANPYL